MSKTPQYRICWDTSVFLAWFNEEASAPLGDIDIVLELIHSGKALLIVSVTTYTEIVHAKHTDEQIALLDLFLKRSNVVRADTTFAVAQKAEQVRSRGIELAPSKHEVRNIKTPDATIIATAIVHQVDVLHSLEPRHIALSESPIVDGLKITAPRHPSGQSSLLNE